MKYSRLLLASALIALLFLSAGCIRPQNYSPISKDSLKGSGKLYLVPLGNFPATTTKELATFYKNKYGLEVETLSSVRLTPAVIDPARDQLIAERAIEIMKQANPQLTNDSQAIMIGLTDRDMYIAKRNWQFSFSLRQEGKYAVVSSGRMHLPNGRREVTEALMLARLRKMVTKNVGILYYRLPASDDPRSVLYRDVGGISELDDMGEEF